MATVQVPSVPCPSVEYKCADCGEFVHVVYQNPPETTYRCGLCHLKRQQYGTGTDEDNCPVCGTYYCECGSSDDWEAGLSAHGYGA